MARPIFTITLNDGRVMRGELYPEIAPNTVANFIALCNKNFYKNLCFHRVINGFMIQGGGFTHKHGLSQKKVNWSISGEFAHNGFFQNNLTHFEGVISMARTPDYDSASTQFFICTARPTHLDKMYAAFGRLDDPSTKIAMEISKAPVHTLSGMEDVPVEPIIIKSIKVDTQGSEYPDPVRFHKK